MIPGRSNCCYFVYSICLFRNHLPVVVSFTLKVVEDWNILGDHLRQGRTICGSHIWSGGTIHSNKDCHGWSGGTTCGGRPTAVWQYPRKLFNLEHFPIYDSFLSNASLSICYSHLHIWSTTPCTPAKMPLLWNKCLIRYYPSLFFGRHSQLASLLRPVYNLFEGIYFYPYY